MKRISPLLGSLCLLLVWSTLHGQDEDPNSGDVFAKGIWSLTGTIKQIHKDALEVANALGNKKIKLKVSADSALEQTDLRAESGRPALGTKRVEFADLHKEDPISVIFYSDGKELVLLRAVASGPKLSGMEVGLDVRKLGGKILPVFRFDKKTAVLVDLSGTSASDVDLALLSPSPTISSLDLSFTKITDKALASLTGLKGLQSLKLAGTKVTDDGIQELKRLPSLITLDVSDTAITDEGIADFANGKGANICRVASGDKRRFQVHQEFIQGMHKYNYLMINDTYFGRYYLGEFGRAIDGTFQDRRREATTYYHRNGPVGQVYRKMEWFTPAGLLDYPSDSRLPASLWGLLAPTPTTSFPAGALVGLLTEPPIAVIRLNVGTHAAYGRLFQPIHFYNSTPEIRAFSLPTEGQPVYFGYVQDALHRGCAVQVIDGPERAQLSTKSPKAFYQAMFVDIARNDLRDVATELMTKEALAEMMESLTDSGIVCFHTSHRYHDFTKPVIDAAKSLNLSWKVGNDRMRNVNNRESPNDSSHFGGEWVAIARNKEYLQHLSDFSVDDFGVTWTEPLSTGKHLWRDGEPRDIKPLKR